MYSYVAIFSSDIKLFRNFLAVYLVVWIIYVAFLECRQLIGLVACLSCSFWSKLFIGCLLRCLDVYTFCQVFELSVWVSRPLIGLSQSSIWMHRYFVEVFNLLSVLPGLLVQKEWAPVLGQPSYLMESCTKAGLKLLRLVFIRRKAHSIEQHLTLKWNLVHY